MVRGWRTGRRRVVGGRKTGKVGPPQGGVGRRCCDGEDGEGVGGYSRIVSLKSEDPGVAELTPTTTPLALHPLTTKVLTKYLFFCCLVLLLMPLSLVLQKCLGRGFVVHGGLPRHRVFSAAHGGAANGAPFPPSHPITPGCKDSWATSVNPVSCFKPCLPPRNIQPVVGGMLLL